MHEGQLRGMRDDDALLVISLGSGEDEALDSVRVARSVGIPVIVITDDLHNPMTAAASVSLLAPESTTLGFRALTNAMTLAQSLFVALASRLSDHPLPTLT